MIGLFGYPGDQLARTTAVCDILKKRGATQLVCMGGLVWSGRREDEQGAPASVLRWLRANEIPTLSNDADRQVSGWRLQALSNTTGFIQPRIRKLLAEITREEAQWLYSRPTSITIGKVLCCSDNLTLDAIFPVPLTRYNATRLFSVMEQKAAFFPSANGPSLLVRKQSETLIEVAKYQDVEEQLDGLKCAGIIGGIIGHPPLNSDVSWGALVDYQATRISLICVDAKTQKVIPERGTLLLQRTETKWQD